MASGGQIRHGSVFLVAVVGVCAIVGGAESARPYSSHRDTTKEKHKAEKANARVLMYIPNRASTFEQFLLELKAALDSHQLPTRPLYHIFGHGSHLLHCQGQWLEFGVHKGTSLTLAANWRKQHCGPDSPHVHGFDTFTGLPEDWDHGGNSTLKFPKGAFSLDGNLPDVPDNTILHKGLFAETLPRFIMKTDWEALEAPERGGPDLLPEEEGPQGPDKEGPDVETTVDSHDSKEPVVSASHGSNGTRPAGETPPKTRHRLPAGQNPLGRLHEWLGAKRLGGHGKLPPVEALPERHAEVRRDAEWPPAEVPQTSKEPDNLHTPAAKQASGSKHPHTRVLLEAKSGHGLQPRPASSRQIPTALRPWGYPATIPFPGVSYIHIDCDLYRGAADALFLLTDYIRPGTLLLFDDLINYPSYREHEVKALWEWLVASGRRLRVVGAMGWQFLDGPEMPDIAMELNPGNTGGLERQSAAFIVV
eukprot:jgi/Botrbrau1/22854/Bobra.0065s0013.1